MARVHLKQPEELTGEARKAYETLAAAGKITNMKLVMLQDYGTYKAFMGWYDSWESLEKAVGLRAATIYAHSISTTNGCMLCSLFFISDLKELGLDPRRRRARSFCSSLAGRSSATRRGCPTSC